MESERISAHKLVKIINSKSTICTIKTSIQLHYLLPSIAKEESGRAIIVQTYSAYNNVIGTEDALKRIAFLLLPKCTLQSYDNYGYHVKFLGQRLGVEWGKPIYLETHYNSIILEVNRDEDSPFTDHRGMSFLVDKSEQIIEDYLKVHDLFLIKRQRPDMSLLDRMKELLVIANR